MLELTKKPHTDLVELRFLVRKSNVAAATRAMEPYAATEDDVEMIPWREAFPDFGPHTAIVGGRTKEGLTQQELAKRLGISRSNLSAMENGKRTIGTKMAKRLGEALQLDYRLFL